ncbi:uncharacterized protein LOC135110402 isoform X2 [Scylla paramamosain]|uniref:uncharacterized protein LOC135110402 isoform X2 n=1 Tax=Scylla paramamosain TaxID=85552 RepID=UPI0030835BCD
MTWLWVKKRRDRTIFLTFILTTTLLHLTTADDETTTTTTIATTLPNAAGGGGGEGGGGGGGGGEGEGSGGGLGNSSSFSPYLDLTKFVDGLNNWDFMGAWAKYDLSLLDEALRPLPLVPDAEDQGVFICQTSALPSTLQKTFPTLHNATLSLTYYAKASDGQLSMTGEVVTAEGARETLFNYSVTGEGAAHPEGSWGTDTFEIPPWLPWGASRFCWAVQHSEAGMWAAADITVEGMTGPPITTTPVNGTTAAPPNVTTITTTTTTEEENLSSLESVAQAIWDAFYVFLALFCACLVALVALIVHGRCKDDEPPPAVATYNPRTASYRMDKVYDNPSYDNNAV